MKVYGANTTSVLNASMGFDDATLQPTYLLRLGAPGKSAGLDIATRLGLPPRLIERARGAMSTTERDIARFLSELHERIEQTAGLQRELEQRMAALQEREASLEVERERRESAKIRELDRRYEALAASFENEARGTIDAIKELTGNRKASEQALRKIAKTQREFSEQIAASKPEQQLGPKVEEGSRVMLKGIRQPARVRRFLSDDLIEVEAGVLRMQVALADVQEVLPDG
ncbi:MAG: endonuclease MutS2, partial [Bryobacteraceae bacterium]